MDSLMDWRRRQPHLHTLQRLGVVYVEQLSNQSCSRKLEASDLRKIYGIHIRNQTLESLYSTLLQCLLGNGGDQEAARDYTLPTENPFTPEVALTLPLCRYKEGDAFRVFVDDDDEEDPGSGGGQPEFYKVRSVYRTGQGETQVTGAHLRQLVVDDVNSDSIWVRTIAESDFVVECAGCHLKEGNSREGCLHTFREEDTYPSAVCYIDKLNIMKASHRGRHYHQKSYSIYSVDMEPQAVLERTPWTLPQSLLLPTAHRAHLLLLLKYYCCLSFSYKALTA
jgi:hypothetical protein